VEKRVKPRELRASAAKFSDAAFEREMKAVIYGNRGAAARSAAGG